MLAQMKSWMKTIEERLFRSPSMRSPKSSNSSFSSSPKGGGSPGGTDGGDQGDGGGSSADSSTSTHAWSVFQKFKLDKDRGAALSQHHLSIEDGWNYCQIVGRFQVQV